MASKRTGFRVEVIPVGQRDYPWVSTLVGQANSLVAEIKRHVDHVEDAYPVYSFSCEHCGAKWTEVSQEYNGGCCEKDEANNPNPEQPND